MVTTLREIFWNTSMTKRPPSSGGMGSRLKNMRYRLMSENMGRNNVRK